MKKCLIFSIIAALLIGIDGDKIKKCYTVIPRCPQLLTPCPSPAQCEKNSIVSNRDNGCCCMSSIECAKNEVYLEEPHIAADPTCDLRNPFPAGAVGPLPGCYCNAGFVRDKKYKCIAVEECPVPSSKCGRNEVFKQCGQAEAFIPTCDNPFPSVNSMAPPVCKIGCYCKDGYVRNKDWKCIRLSKCPAPSCGVNEIYSDCNTNCAEPTCQDPSVFSCGYTCNKGCFCESGFVRNDESKCVRLRDCRRHREL